VSEAERARESIQKEDECRTLELVKMQGKEALAAAKVRLAQE
jgi:hypothetical protein